MGLADSTECVLDYVRSQAVQIRIPNEDPRPPHASSYRAPPVRTAYAGVLRLKLADAHFDRNERSETNPCLERKFPEAAHPPCPTEEPISAFAAFSRPPLATSSRFPTSIYELIRLVCVKRGKINGRAMWQRRRRHGRRYLKAASTGFRYQPAADQDRRAYHLRLIPKPEDYLARVAFAHHGTRVTASGRSKLPNKPRRRS